jgi:ABC-type branched-subunit amino acid transport system substrate-binding protein
MTLVSSFPLTPWVLASLFVLLSSSLFSQSAPHFEARKHESLYHGPGRDEALPAPPSEIRIGYFGPTDPSDPEGGQMWFAAQLALDEANSEGGYQGTPFRLIPTWSENPWGSGISQLARSIYTDELWAVIGSIDGPSTHLVEQLVAKARLPLINPASSDKTVNLANVPWMFSCLPGEHLQVPALAEVIAEATDGSTLTILSATDHDSRVFSKELRNQLSLNGVALGHHFELDEKVDTHLSTVDQVLAAQSKVVVIIAGPSGSALIVKHLRKKKFPGRIFGGPNMGRNEFLREAGSAALGVTFPLLVSVLDEDGFSENFEARFGTPPDYRSLQTYDAVNLLIGAIRKAGLNRARIRDALRALSPWQGISGPIVWDALGQNVRTVRLATVANHRLVTLQESCSK